MTPWPLEKRVFAAAASSLTGQPVDAAHAGRFLGDMGSRAPFHVAWGLRLILWLTFLAPLCTGRARSFLGLGDGDRSALWARALESRSYAVRQLAMVLKAMVCLCCFDLDSPGERVAERRPVS